MKKTLLHFLLMMLSFSNVLAQPTQAELDKMMKQAQEQLKKYGNDSTLNKMMKGVQDQQKQVTDAMQNKNNQPQTGPNNSFAPDQSEYGNVDNWKFPAKNTAMLSAIPKTVFTRALLISYLNDIYVQLSKKLPAGVVSSVKSIISKYGNDGSKMGDVAVNGWYTNFREESILLIVKAAALNPDDGLLLNNCAAILNMGGIEEKAVPILKYLLQFNPGSSMVLNNLGQAYAGLGETDTAQYYLGRSIKAEPENPEANNTAGQIEAARGNTDKAISYFEQSIKGAYNKPAELKLKKIKKGAAISPLVRPRVKYPEYFNLFKYKLPAQCTSTNNAAEAKAEYTAFRKVIEQQIEKYSGKLAQLQVRMYEHPLPSRIFKKDDLAAQPFSAFCGIMQGEVSKELYDGMAQYDKKYYADYLNIENEYKAKYELIKKTYKDREEAAAKAGCCGEGNVSCCVPEGEACKAYTDLANQYLPKYAMLTEDFQEKNEDHFKKFFDELVYWGYLHMHPLSDDIFRMECFYPAVISYLGMLGKVGYTKIIETCHFEPTTANADSNAIKEIECPINIQIPLAVGKIQLNCDKFLVSGGEGIVFGYEKSFKTHQSTLSAGIGLTLELTAKSGPIKAGVSGSATETAFITFDGNNGIADVGIKNEAKLSASAPVIGKKETSIGSTLGINSGWNFNEGPFKGMIGPSAPIQQNKNVNIYKSKN